MTSAVPTRPDWTIRILAAVCYLGLVPLLMPFRLARHDGYLWHHRRQALALLLVPGALLLAGVLGVVFFGLSDHADDLEDPASRTGNVLATGGFLGGLGSWAVVGLVGTVLALAGSLRRIPGIDRVAKNCFWTRLSLVANGLVWLAVGLLLAAALHTAALIRPGGEPNPVYALYHDEPFESIPLWIRELRFYRMALAARERWGPKSMIVAPLNRQNLKEALGHGRFVVLWGHGTDGFLVTAEGYLVGPSGKGRISIVDPRGSSSFAEVFEVNKELRVIYLTGCDAGRRAREWREAFAPATVFSFDRKSGGMEHILWAWFIAPGRLKEIH
jgi:hypothetical protein